METPDVKVAQMGVNAQAFAQSLVNDNFTHTPTTKVDAKHAAALAKVGDAITGLGGKEAIQEGRGFELATEMKATSRHQIEALLRKANRTAGAIAEDTSSPEIMAEFRMPHGRGDETLKTRANSMADAIDELGLEDEFEGHSLPDFAKTLRDAASNFQVDSGSQAVAQSKQVGAGKGDPRLYQDDQVGGEDARCALQQFLRRRRGNARGVEDGEPCRESLRAQPAQTETA